MLLAFKSDTCGSHMSDIVTTFAAVSEVELSDPPLHLSTFIHTGEVH